MTLYPLIAVLHVIEKIVNVTPVVERVHLSAYASVLSCRHVVDQITGAISELDHACVIYAGIGKLTNLASCHHGCVSKIGSGKVGFDEGCTPCNWDLRIAQFVESFDTVEALSGEYRPEQVDSLERCIDHGVRFVESRPSQASRVERYAKEVGLAKVRLGYIAPFEFHINKFCSLERRSGTEDNAVYGGLDHCYVTVVERSREAARELILCALRNVHASKLEALPRQVDKFVSAAADCFVAPVRCEHRASIAERFHALERKALNSTPVDFACFECLPDLNAQGRGSSKRADTSENETSRLTHGVFVGLSSFPAAQGSSGLVSAPLADGNSFHAHNSTNDCTQVQEGMVA